MKPWAIIIISLVLTSRTLTAATQLYVHDDDELARIVVETGQVLHRATIGSTDQPVLDVAVSDAGRLIGITARRLYDIDRITGATSEIGQHDVDQGNSLVFGEDGWLYAAGKNVRNVFRINPDTALAQRLGGSNDLGFNGAGDLAFWDGQLYLSANGTTEQGDQLVSVNTSTGIGSALGFFQVDDMLGLASTANDQLLGASKNEIYEITPQTGSVQLLQSFASSGLADFWGADTVPVIHLCDINADGPIDASDMGIMFSEWGGEGLGDVNMDSLVDAADAGQCFAYWTGDISAVPEAISGGWIFVVLLLVKSRRLRNY